MKLIRKIQEIKISRFFIPAIAVLFVFSLSFHNHALGEHADTSFDSHHSSSHSAEDCSACLLQGKIEVPKVEYSFNNNEIGLHISYFVIDQIVPDSFGIIDQPSRAPPIA